MEWIIPLILIVAVTLAAILIYCKKKATPSTVSVDEIVGMQGRVVSPIDNLSGSVIVRGTEWSARTTSDDYSIPQGKTVTILAVEGVQLIVK